LKADPEVQARIYHQRLYLRRLRAALRWIILWSPLLGLVLYIFLSSKLLALLPSIVAPAVWFYYERRLHAIRFIPCLQCDKQGRYVVPFDDWVCGWCKKTHTYTWLPTRRTWLERCHCNAVIHSFICPGCREPIRFDDYEFKSIPDKPAWLPDHPPLTKAAAPAKSYDDRRRRLQIK
jgi:hypothetical protein